MSEDLIGAKLRALRNPVNAATGTQQTSLETAPATAGVSSSGSPESDLISSKMLKLRTAPSTPTAIPSPMMSDQEIDFSIGHSLLRGTLNLASNWSEAWGDVESADEIRQYASNYEAAYPDITKVSGAGGVGGFAGERLLENVPQLGVTGLLFAAGSMVGTPLLGVTLAGAYNFINQLGESRGTLREGGEDNLAVAIPTAVVNTGIEMVPLGMVAKRMGLLKPLKESITESLDVLEKTTPGFKDQLMNAARDFIKVGGSEAGVETIQTFNNMVANKLQNKVDMDLLGQGGIELINAAAGGFFAGGGTGAAASVYGDNFADPQKLQDSTEVIKPEDVLKQMITEKIAAIEANDLTILNEANDYDHGTQGIIGGRMMGTKSRGPWGNRGTVTTAGKIWSQSGVSLNSARLSQYRTDENGAEVLTPATSTKLPYGRATFVTSKIKDSDYALAASEQELLGDTSDQDSINTLYKNVFKPLEASLTQLMDEMGLGDMRLIFGTEATISELTGLPTSNALGYVLDDDTNTYYIAINPDVSKTINTPAGKQDASTTRKFAVMDTAFHEFGHAIANHKWKSLSEDQKKGMLSGYKKYMEDVLQSRDKGNIDELITKYYSPATQNIYLKSRKDVKKYLGQEFDPSVRNPEYFLNFDEYMAQQFARYVSRKTGSKELNLPIETASFFDSVLKVLRRVYRYLKKHSTNAPTFEAFIDNIFLKKQLENLQNAYQELTGEAYQTANDIKSDLKAEGATSTDSGLNGSSNTVAFSEQKQYPLYNQPIASNILDRFGLGKQASDIRQHEDLQLGFAKIAGILTPIQMAELAKRSGLKNPGEYMDRVREFALTKMTQIEQADKTITRWRKMGKDSSRKISSMLFEASTLSDTEGRRLKESEILSLASKLKLTEAELQMWRDIDESFQNVLRNIERGLVYEASRAYIKDLKAAKEFRDRYLEAKGDSAAQIQLIEEYTGMDLVPTDPDSPIINPLFTELGKVDKHMEKLYNKNYFPRTRMGEYTIKIVSTKKGQDWDGTISKKAGETLGFYAFDSKRERDAMMAQMTPDAKAAGVAMTGSKLESESFAVMGMPQVLIDSLKRSEENAILNNEDLTDKQKSKMLKDMEKRYADVSLELSPGKKFLQHLRKRKGIAGFSEDALRVYANYMMSSANHLARTEHSRDLIESLNDMDAHIKLKQQTGFGIVLDDLVRVRDYYRRHFNYLMRPDNDWANLRSVGFLWYLGFNIKSAVLNLTQIPLVTYPVLAGKFGDGKAVKAIAKAYADVNSNFFGKKGLSEEDLATLDYLTKAGVIDESMAMELAGLGEQDTLKRAIPGMGLDGMLNKVAYYGAWGFRVSEKYNRTVTAIAAFRLARESGMDMDASVKEAQSAIETSQFEYAKWNRPEFMRGKKSVLFLFWQYMQHASFLFAGGAGKKTAARLWLMTLVVAGLEGVPFAETILDLIDWGGTQVKQMTGSANPRVAIREDIRELLLEITDQPDKVLYGMAGMWGLGPLHLASLLGAPVPNVDVSASVGFGRPIPWAEPILTGTSDDPTKRLGEITASLLGPVGGIPFQAYKSLNSTDPNTWRTVEGALPVFMKNATKGARWLTEGEETFRGEGTFMDFRDPEGRVSAILKGMGFQPTAVTQKYRQIRASQTAATYWSLRRSMLMEDYYYMRVTKDREGLADVKRAIKDHNKAMREATELRGLVITSKDLSQSVKSRARQVRLRELGKADPRRQLLNRRIQELFPTER